MNGLKDAANKVDAIRNNRTESADVLLKRLDAIGCWLARQKNGKLVTKLLSECHHLADRLRLQIQHN